MNAMPTRRRHVQHFVCEGARRHPMRRSPQIEGEGLRGDSQRVEIGAMPTA